MLKKILSVVLSLVMVISLFADLGGMTVSANTQSVTDFRINGLKTVEGIDKIPQFSWIIKTPGLFGQVQTAYQILIYSTAEKLNADDPDVWDSGKVISDQNYDILYSGPTLQSKSQYFCRAKVWGNGDTYYGETTNQFSTGMLTGDAWNGAKWITKTGDNSRAATLLRKEFTISKSVKSASVYISGLGLFDLEVNGSKPDDSVLNPANTDFDDRVPYQAFPVTSLLSIGSNAIGVELGHGFYSSSMEGWNWSTVSWKDNPKLLLCLNIKYIDGTEEDIISDESWRVSKDGPITDNDIYFGDVYDARKEASVANWTKAGFNDATWLSAGVAASPKGKLQSQIMEPMRRNSSHTPESVTKISDNSYVVKMPKNMTGWIRTTFRNQPADKTITMCYGEKLNNDGSVVTQVETNVRTDGSKVRADTQTDTYITKGGSSETYEPKFSYKGFQYVYIKGVTGTLNVSDIIGYYIYNDTEETGVFNSSNTLINKMHDAMIQTSCNNFQGKPTDTPFYEKNGWFGDANVSLDTFAYNFNLQGFLGKFMDDIVDVQDADGSMKGLAPNCNWGTVNAPVWYSILFFLPENFYDYYGNKTIISDYYAAMSKTAEMNLKRIKNNNWIWPGGELEWSDWLPPTGVESLSNTGDAPEGGVIHSTAYIYKIMETMARFAKILEKTADEAAYNDAKQNIKSAFNAKYYKPAKGIYESPYWIGGAINANRIKYRQTVNIVPLVFGICEDANRQTVIDNLLADIKDKNYHLDTGVIGTKYILPLLEQTGNADIAYKLLNQTTYPSWGYWFEQGATTLWEAWESVARSHSHYFLGTFDEWLYSGLAGIKNIKKGYRTFTINPNFENDLSSVSASVQTIRGNLTSKWNYSANGVNLEIEIPTGSTAEIILPTNNISVVNVNGDTGTAVATSSGVKSVGNKDGKVMLTVGSGRYVINTTDTTRFSLEVKRSNDLQAKNYTSEAWTAFQSAKSTAETFLSGTVSSSQSEIETALSNFRAALTTLETQKNQGRIDLENYLIKLHENINKNEYISSGYAVYKEQLDKAELALSNDTQTSAQLMTALNSLKTVVDTLMDYHVGNLALKKTVSASSSVGDSRWAVTNVVDGDRQNKNGTEYCGWSTSENTGSSHTEWLVVDLGMKTKFNRVTIYPSTSAIGTPNSCYGFPEDFTIYTSNDGENWKSVYSKTGYSTPSYEALTFNFTKEYAQYIKFEGSKLRPKSSDGNTYRIQLAEFEVYNTSIPGGIQDVNETKYYYKDGQPVENKMETVNGESYYFGTNGVMQKNVATTIGGKIYYFKADGKLVKNGFYTYRNKTYCADETGARIISGFSTLDGVTYYIGADGLMVCSKTVISNGKIYYLGSDGKLVKSAFYTYGNKTYCADDSGARIFNTWKKVLGKDYYIGGDGVKVINRIVEGFFIGNDGIILCKKRTVLNGRTYITDKNGKIYRKAMLLYGGKTYIAGGDGALYIGVRLLNFRSEQYYIDASGAVAKNRKVIYKKANYFANSSGKIKKGPVILIIGKKKYFVTKSGKFLKNKWVKYKKKWYYADKKSELVVNKKSYKIGNQRYKFNNKGICLNKK